MAPDRHPEVGDPRAGRLDAAPASPAPEGGDRGPTALGPQEPPALERGPAALGEPRGDEGVVGVLGAAAGGAELGEDRLGVLPGTRDGPQKAPRMAG